VSRSAVPGLDPPLPAGGGIVFPYLVMLAYSLLMSRLRHSCARGWALHRLTTIGKVCRAMLRENLCHAGLGDPAGNGEGAAVWSCDCPIGPRLALQNSS